ncbi:MAG: caspase family protein [Acidiferrobacterales bacterium]|nr:caspase family protein [Acidiferrobacterales bacterium]
MYPLIKKLILIFALSLMHGQTIASSRVALIIGNSDYQWSPLENPINDANDMANTLSALGFDVMIQTDARRVAMHRAIREFGKKLSSAEIGLFYYAGHGVQVGGRNYLVPTDADIREEDEVAFETIDAARILEKMESAQNPVNIVILDACRNNPFASNSRTTSRGLARMDSPVGSLLLYATAPNKTAADGEGRNGVLTGNLIKHLSEPGLALNEIILRTRVGVMSETNDQQVPWSASSLTRNVVLNQVASLDNSQIAANLSASTQVTSQATSQPVLQGSPQGVLSQSEKLMQICNKHYQANRLTAGAGGSALACYQQVLASDPFNISALEGIENVANKYFLRAENAIKAQRYASAERHLGNLKQVNPEHPGVEDIEYALKRALFASAAPTTPKPVIAVEKSPVQPLQEPSTENATVVSVVNTPANGSLATQTTPTTTVAPPTNNASLPSEPLKLAAAPEKAQSLNSLTQLPQSTIPGLTINGQPSNDNGESRGSEQITLKSAETSSIIKTVVEEASSVEDESITSEELEIALAKPVDGKPYQLCPNCMQPASNRGQPCIQHEVLKGEFITANGDFCHTKIGGKCMDVVYKFRLKNVCESAMKVEWAFSTFSGGTLVGRNRIEIGGTREVTCLNKEHDCSGQIRYGWDTASQ